MFKSLIAALVFVLPSLALADISVSGIRVKAPVPGQHISAGYMQITNSGDSAVTLVAVSSENASSVEMHTHIMENGMMGMVQLDSVEVAAAETLEFKEGGHHLMIFDPDSPAIDSGQFELIFLFSDGSRIVEAGIVEHLVPRAAHQH